MHERSLLRDIESVTMPARCVGAAANHGSSKDAAVHCFGNSADGLSSNDTRLSKWLLPIAGHDYGELTSRQKSYGFTTDREFLASVVNM